MRQKPFFKEAFQRSRCLIPASGYYEWHYANPEDKKQKPQPYYFTRRDGRPITFAGLWDTWHDRSQDKMIESCTMIITEPNKLVAEVHDRMPVVLEREHFDTWMRTQNVEEADLLMKPAGEDVLQKWPVSKRINSSKTEGDDRSLTEEVDPARAESSNVPTKKAERQRSLF